MHPCAPNAGYPVCCGIKYPDDTPVVTDEPDEPDERMYRSYPPSYVNSEPSPMSRVRNGDALVGGVKIMGVGWNPSLSDERFGGCFGERLRAENSSESDLGLG